MGCGGKWCARLPKIPPGVNTQGQWGLRPGICHLEEGDSKIQSAEGSPRRGDPYREGERGGGGGKMDGWQGRAYTRSEEGQSPLFFSFFFLLFFSLSSFFLIFVFAKLSARCAKEQTKERRNEKRKRGGRKGGGGSDFWSRRPWPSGLQAFQKHL